MYSVAVFDLIDKGYTLYEDRYLLWAAGQLGYGQWKALIQMIRDEPTMKFNYWMQSRSALELQRRVNALLRLINSKNDKPTQQSRGRTKKRINENNNNILPSSESLDSIAKQQKLE